MAADNDDASIFRFASVLVVAFHCAAVSFGTARRASHVGRHKRLGCSVWQILFTFSSSCCIYKIYIYSIYIMVCICIFYLIIILSF